MAVIHVRLALGLMLWASALPAQLSTQIVFCVLLTILAVNRALLGMELPRLTRVPSVQHFTKIALYVHLMTLAVLSAVQ
jgi:hypothetical protein